MLVKNIFHDKSKCASTVYQGGTGCCCNYCTEYSASGKKWEVSVKGTNKSGEIALVLETNRHGFASYGWFDEYKILIFSCQDWNQVPKEIWKAQIALAKKQCAIKNKYET